jgi:hypothetical protein
MIKKILIVFSTNPVDDFVGNFIYIHNEAVFPKKCSTHFGIFECYLRWNHS